MPHLSLLSPTGPLTVFEDAGALVAVEWGRADKGAETPLLVEARRQLNQYFDRERQVFDLPLAPQGTEFQRAVWAEMSKIPYGAMATYGELAKTLHSAARAVGGACGKNPIPIIIPCHRVLGQGGRMTGFSGGDGISTKSALLQLEGTII
ncbi:MAG: methylated-DNA--[protein]-cysteine S-methyltransferase [Rhodospirillales bacterium]|nr:methylated-DNA--[protein]-cysteine S-methyltransferase [Rhodospirillales bacterium]